MKSYANAAYSHVNGTECIYRYYCCAFVGYATICVLFRTMTSLPESKIKRTLKLMDSDEFGACIDDN